MESERRQHWELLPGQEDGLDGSWLERKLAQYAAAICADPPSPSVAFSQHGRGLAYKGQPIELTIAPTCPRTRVIFVPDRGCKTDCSVLPAAGPAALDGTLRATFVFREPGNYRACVGAPVCAHKRQRRQRRNMDMAKRRNGFRRLLLAAPIRRHMRQ